MTAGVFILRIDGVEVSRQEITEPLPAHLAISGNQSTEIHFLAIDGIATMASAGAAAR